MKSCDISNMISKMIKVSYKDNEKIDMASLNKAVEEVLKGNLNSVKAHQAFLADVFNEADDIIPLNEFQNLIHYIRKHVTEETKDIKPIIDKYVTSWDQLNRDTRSFHTILKQDKELLDTLKNYTSDEYVLINKKFREMYEESGVRQSYQASMIDKLGKLFEYEGDYLGTMYRGTNQVNKKIFNYVKVGDIITSPSPLSTSKSIDEAWKWAESGLDSIDKTRVVFRIDNNKIPQYNIEKYSTFPEEKEVLVEPHLPMKITKIIKNPGGINMIHLEVLPIKEKDFVEGKVKAIHNLLGFGGVAVALGHQREETK